MTANRESADEASSGSALRSMLIWAGIGFITLLMYPLGLVLFLLTLPFDRQRAISHYYAARWARTCVSINRRWRFEVTGEERIPRGRPVVLVANHQGTGDILIAFQLRTHFKWIAKEVIFKVPVLGWF